MVGDQSFSVLWKIFKILNILMRTLYLVFPPLVLVKNILIMKAMSLLREEVTSQMLIHTLQFIFTLHKIKSKR